MHKKLLCLVTGPNSGATNTRMFQKILDDDKLARDYCKSTSKHIFPFGGAIISWSSKKQICVSRHTQEAEYIACSIATTFVISINRFIKDMELDITNGPVHMYYDN